MADPIFELTRVGHDYSGKTVLDIDRLSVERGSILGISGANGSGKTTLLKLLGFAMAPTRGQIRFNGQREYPMSPRVRARISLLTQTPYLLRRSVLDNLAYGLKLRKETRDIQKRAAAALEAVGLSFSAFSGRLWHELSGGEAQRVALAARLILRPAALLLDEPVASVDARSAALIRNAALLARQDWGCTIVVVSHDLAWLHEISDTRLSMSAGKCYATGEESVIPGPYATDDRGRPVKRLETGRSLVLADAPLPEGLQEKTAVIARAGICLGQAGENRADGANQVPAVITQMLLEKKTGQVLATLDMAGVDLVLRMEAGQAAQQGLIPGKAVVAVFSPGSVTWR